MIDSNSNTDVIVGRIFLEDNKYEFCKWSFSSSKTYMLNNKKQWIQIQVNTGGGGGGK